MGGDMAANSSNNYAFIDSTNLHLGIKALDWSLDYKKFRRYLAEKYGVKKAYMFMGFDPNQQTIYRFLQEAGYILEFKPILRLKNGKVKGNCDAELVLRAMLDYGEYDHAVVVTGDGDFHCLVTHLEKQKKLEVVFAPSQKGCSVLLTRAVPKRLVFVSDQRSKLEYKKKSP
jgi:uncharacterized LabA/DUF88 family protein